VEQGGAVVTQLAERSQNLPLAQPAGFSTDQIDLIKNTVAVGTSDLELALFLEVCRSTGLNPFQRQVYAVVRKGKTKQGNQWVETSKMVIQTGIDGYRLIAARSGVHMGTTDPEFGPLKDGYPEFARVIVRKLVHGQMVEFPATARWAEYVQTKAEYQGGSATGKQIVSDMWAKMPHTMLGKCSEALALRKAFPAELSGVYSDVEMQQADNPATEAAPAQQARTVDVTREVAQAAGVEPQQVTPARSPALIAWEEKIGKVGARLTELGLREKAVMVMRQHPHWKTDLGDAQAVYEGMKRIGEQHAEDMAARTAQEDDLPNAATLPLDIDEPVEATLVLSPEGLKALQTAYGNKLGLKTPEQRHDFATWMLTLPEQLASTKDLSEDQASFLTNTINGWADEEVADQLAKFQMWQEQRLPF